MKWRTVRCGSVAAVDLAEIACCPKCVPDLTPGRIFVRSCSEGRLICWETSPTARLHFRAVQDRFHRVSGCTNLAMSWDPRKFSMRKLPSRSSSMFSYSSIKGSDTHCDRINFKDPQFAEDYIFKAVMSEQKTCTWSWNLATGREIQQRMAGSPARFNRDRRPVHLIPQPRLWALMPRGSSELASTCCTTTPTFQGNMYRHFCVTSPDSKAHVKCEASDLLWGPLPFFSSKDLIEVLGLQTSATMEPAAPNPKCSLLPAKTSTRCWLGCWYPPRRYYRGRETGISQRRKEIPFATTSQEDIVGIRLL